MTQCSSDVLLVVAWSEFAGAAIISNNPALIGLLFDQTCPNELSHEASCIITNLVVVFQLGDPLLHGIELGELCLRVKFLLLGSQLVFFDLRDSSAPLRRNLEHVGRDTLAHYEKEIL